VPDPAYQTDFQVSVVQPLMRGRGKEVTRANQTLLRNQEKRAEIDLRGELVRVVESAELAYLDLQLAWKNLAIQEQLIQRGAEVERVLRERQSFDAKPAEYSDALATLEQRRANRVRAARLVAEASDRLKDIVNDEQTPLVSESLLLPAEPLTANPFEGNLKDLMWLALQQRPEVERAVLAIDDAQLRQRVAENLRQPQLDLRGGASVSGLDGQPGGSYGDLATENNYTFFLGLSFELPSGNRSAAARERQAVHESRASLVRYEQVVRGVLHEVKDALRRVRTNEALVAASINVRLAQTENLRALIAEQEQRGNLSPESLNLLFVRQEGLARAQLEEMLALTDYNRALAGLRRVLAGGPRGERLEWLEPKAP